MSRSGLSLLIALLLPLGSLLAAPEEWNAIQKASGWASFDRDGSCTFYDMAAKKLINWSWESGVQSQLDTSKLALRPEKWVLDSASNAWVIASTNLQFIDKSGRPGTSITLPAEVGDLAWDATSFVLCYRTQEFYLEKRDLKTGAVLWSYGAKPAKGEFSPQVRHHIAIKEDGQVIIASGASLAVITLDGAKGKPLGTTAFSKDGAEPPVLVLHNQDRGNIVWWLGTNTALAAVPASQVEDLKMEGLLLVKLDFAQHTATFLPTGLSEGHNLIGVLEKVAVFRVPSGGLAFVNMD